MEFLEARESVIAAGKRLVETGLIARTWGNVSCRVGGDRFAVTPTGRSYESLLPEDIVIVNIADLGYEGPIKPSSEKGVHAEVYSLKPDARFVIHTHQTNASVAAALGKPVEMVSLEARRLIGEMVELAAYGLPGSKKLRRGVSEALLRSKGRAVLMAHHGALCFGADAEEAFAAALALEDECARFASPGQAEQPTGPLPLEELTGAIRSARKDIRVVRACSLPAVVEASRRLKSVQPYLDDFAQLIGFSARCIAWDDGDAGASVRSAITALRGRNAVLIKGRGALCCAGNEEDAVAVEMVLEKGCLTAMAAGAYGGARPIAPAECALMRHIYLHKYSRQMELNRNGQRG